MSLNNKKELNVIAKGLCRELRKKSTRAEQIFWEAVRGRKFLNKKFYRQYPIFYDLTGKESFFIVDFYSYEDKLIIELDGIIHKYKLADDKSREKILSKLGLIVLRFENEDIEKNLDKTLEKLEKFISIECKSSHSNGERLVVQETK